MIISRLLEAAECGQSISKEMSSSQSLFCIFNQLCFISRKVLIQPIQNIGETILLEIRSIILFQYLQIISNLISYQAIQVQILQNMFLKTKIQDHSFTLSIGSGHNDWAWLSHYVARKFSKISYPQGTYLPTQLHLNDKQGNQYHPHPKERINIFLEENNLTADSVVVAVKIRKGNHTFTEFEKVWQKEAFGIQRFMMNVIYILDATNMEKTKPNEKEFYFKVSFNYTMHPSVKHLFSEKKYESPIEVQLDQKAIGPKMFSFKCQIKLPYGSLVPELYYYWRDPKDPEVYRSQKVKDVKLKQDSFKVNLMISPKHIPIEEINSIVAEEMKISENITKSLQEKELQAKKRNANSSLCCFVFENLWKIIEQTYGSELMLDNYDKSTKERLKVILEKSLNSIYEIFFYYFIVENQTKEKKEELGVTYQHVMHFLRFYGVFVDIESLQGFLEYYNNDFKFRNIKDTVDIDKKAVKFPQFIAILLRAIQFIQTSTFMVKGQTFDVSVAKMIDKIIDIDSQEEEFGQFKRNVRENPKIISFFRNNCEPLKNIFVNRAMKSTQNSADNFVIMKEEFKSMLELSGLTNKNTDSIVQDLFKQLNLSDEGIFYYQFIEAMQWLALALVSSEKDQNDNIENQEQEALLVIEKVKFFMEKVQLS